jgi:hypothetical protein
MCCKPWGVSRSSSVTCTTRFTLLVKLVWMKNSCVLPVIEQRRVLQRLAVLQELLVGLLQALVRPLVLDGEVALVPDIGPTLAAAQLGRARLEGEELVGRVQRRRRGMVHQRAQVEKVLLVDLALGGCVAAPLGVCDDVDQNRTQMTRIGRMRADDTVRTPTVREGRRPAQHDPIRPFSRSVLYLPNTTTDSERERIPQLRLAAAFALREIRPSSAESVVVCSNNAATSAAATPSTCAVAASTDASPLSQCRRGGGPR